MSRIKTESVTDRQERIPHFSQAVIRQTRVAVMGAGATANEVLKNLALMGFPYIFVADLDHISTSNLSRTVLFDEQDVGKPKAPTAAQRFCAMGTAHGACADWLSGDICHQLGDGVLRHVDLVINCVDNNQTRLWVSNLCQLLHKPFIDLGINGFDWNVFVSSGREDCACFACTLSQRQEEAALNRVRNSCDVTIRTAAQTQTVATIIVPAASAGAFAAHEAVKISHALHRPDSGFPAPDYGRIFLYIAETNTFRKDLYPVRSDCQHHDSYEAHGGVQETPLSARWTLQEALDWASTRYHQDYYIALYKDNECADRGFVTKAACKSCGAELDVYRPQPLRDEDLLCERCRAHLTPNQPLMLSHATLKHTFSRQDEPRLLQMPLAELGIPPLHILEFAPADGTGESLFLELTGDLKEVMPHLPG